VRQPATRGLAPSVGRAARAGAFDAPARKPGDPGPVKVPAIVEGDQELAVGDERRILRPRADQRHLPADHIPELGQPGDARRPQPEKLELVPALTDPPLPNQDRAPVADLGGCREEHHDRQRHDATRRADGHLHSSRETPLGSSPLREADRFVERRVTTRGMGRAGRPRVETPSQSGSRVPPAAAALVSGIGRPERVSTTHLPHWRCALGDAHSRDPEAQPEAVPDLELRQPGTGQGAVTTAQGGRGVQLTAAGLENVPEGSMGIMPAPGLEG
jgi:hypothetical protein